MSIALGVSAAAGAECRVDGLRGPAPRDPLALLLQAERPCPRNAEQLADALQRAGARLQPTMVNFAGFHAPGAGAFFFFEIASTEGERPSGAPAIARGDLVFGHFTEPTADGRLVSSQGKGLVVEAIAWDPDKGYYNFYELMGTTWSYRGDSRDVLEDVALLHRDRAAGVRPFGGRLRCSGCHTSGGLVQKELAAPHNDWFVAGRPLPAGDLRPDAFVRGRIAGVADAGALAELVEASHRRLAASRGYQRLLASRSLQERLRPLFCPVELNLESDTEPFDDRVPVVRVPSGFFTDARLAVADVRVARAAYDAAQGGLRSRLPKTPGRSDADHAWLTPVKARSDAAAVDALVDQGIVDDELVADVLAVDFTNPVFSSARCGLLGLVPAESGSGFAKSFQQALALAKAPAASELLRNLTEPGRTRAFHRQAASRYLDRCRERASDPAAVEGWTRLLAQRRVEVGASEISQNPDGRILEDPGRVVFPETTPRAMPGRLQLTPACDVQ
ncbi:MAG: hypothetical protein ABW221_03390 [Vicinamibacteria bacterium]